VHYTYDTFYPNEPIYFKEDLYPINKLTIFIKYYKSKYSNINKKWHKTKDRTENNKIGIHILDKFQLILYKNLVLNLKTRIILFFC
jgi:hypothetical protein